MFPACRTCRKIDICRPESYDRHMTESRDLIGAAEAARLRNVDTRTIQRWAASGILTPAVKLPGRTGAYLFDRNEVASLDAEAVA